MRQTPTCCSRTATQRRSTRSRARARGPLLRHDVPVRAAGRLVARRHRDARGCRRRLGPFGRATGSPATRCGSRAASTSCPTTSCTWCWRRSPTPDGTLPAGVKGISLFVVPKRLVIRSEGTHCRRAQRRRARRPQPQDGLSRHHQLPAQFRRGQRSARTARPGRSATSWASRARASRCMFHMMNEARIGVGLGATALGYAATCRRSTTRASGRRAATGQLGGKDAGAPQVPHHRARRRRRMLLAQKSYVEGALALNLYCARLVDDTRTAADEAERARRRCCSRC